jgi:hypothetical protein
VAAIVALALLSHYSLKDLRGAWPEGAFHNASANVKVVGLIRNDLGPAPPAKPGGLLVFVLTSGPLNPVALRWVGELNGLPFEAPELQYYDDLAALQGWASRSDYVVLIKPELAIFDRWLPISKLQQALLDWAEANENLQPIGTAGPQDAYKVFAKRPRAAASAAKAS